MEGFVKLKIKKTSINILHIKVIDTGVGIK